ncbi:MAG: threonine/serine dehydratase [Spirochaetaceae bacterium]|nr:MAG: threonine/serine dehydratase [Spirochaetaceae bacterium]
MIDLQTIRAARDRIAPYVHRTPMQRNHSLSKQLGTNVYLKMELFQKTGSFKPRGAFNKMLGHLDEVRGSGVVAMSGGNFAQGVAYAGRALGVRTRIIMPRNTSQNYLDATAAYGGEVELADSITGAFQLAEQYGQEGWSYFHPFDDRELISGHASIGLELLEDVPQLTDVFISVGGGGLMGGITLALKQLKPEIRVWTVETEGSDTLGQALKAGRLVEITPRSLAKTLGAPIVSEDALAIARRFGHRHVVVSDREAYQSLRLLMERAKVITELAASCTLAAAQRAIGSFSPEDHVALVLCGGNLSLDTLVEYRTLFED